MSVIAGLLLALVLHTSHLIRRKTTCFPYPPAREAEYAFRMPFEFETSLSAAQNIDKFYKHLDTVDAEFSALLKKLLPPILPISDVPTQKKTTRQKFNEAVVKHLDQPKAGPTK